MFGLELTGFIPFQVDLSINSLCFKSFCSKIVLLSKLIIRLISFPAGISYILALFINFRVVAAMLPKHHFKLRMWNSALTGEMVKGDDDSATKNIFCSPISRLILKSSPFLTNNNEFKVTFTENLLINRDHPPLNKSKQYLPLELFDIKRTTFYHMLSRLSHLSCCSTLILRGIW